jgi:hypothetical protein
MIQLVLSPDVKNILILRHPCLYSLVINWKILHLQIIFYRCFSMFNCHVIFFNPPPRSQWLFLGRHHARAAPPSSLSLLLPCEDSWPSL